jgi:hypothetical protein
MTTIEFLDSYLPSDLKKMRGWAKVGRPDQILKEMLEHRRRYAPTTPPDEYLREAFDQAGRQGPEHLAAASFQAMFETSYGMLMRLQHVLQTHMRECDQLGNSLAAWQYIAARILPLIERVYRMVLRLTKEYAAAKRWLDLPEWPDSLAALEDLAPEVTPQEPADAADAAPQEPPRVQAVNESADTRPIA